MTSTKPHLPPLITSLSARLLVLTVFFVMLAEFLIWTPSISRFRKVYLEERIVRAHLSMLALDAMGEKKVGKDLEQTLLSQTDTYGIVLNRPDRRMLMVSKAMPPKVDATFDLDKGDFMGWIRDAFDALIQDDNRILRVMARSPKNPTVSVEIVIDETPLRMAMYDYSKRILNLSIVISLFTAGLVYLSLQWLMVAPMRRITASMTAFRDNPEDVSKTIQPSQRSDEIGLAQRELAVMQNQVRTALKQKARLAALGAAVAKINHDLRNTLATAVLASDRLANIDDPEVKQVTPRLYNAIDHAIALCGQTLDYVSDQALTLKPTRFALHDLVAEVGAAMRSAGPAENGLDEDGLDWRNEVLAAFDIVADREQLFRVLSNLGLNAHQAGATRIRVSATKAGESLRIDVADDGPGLPPRARDNLFKPFAAASRQGGTGLGLTIALDIMRAHGGDLTLAETGPDGTTFRLILPIRPHPA